MFNKKPFEEKSEDSNQPKPLIAACNEFDSIYKTNADCVEELVQILGQDNLVCRNCNSNEVIREYGNRNLYCISCKKNSSAFKYTNFDRIKKPRAWLMGIWLTGKGVEYNSNQFHKIAKVSYSTALTITKKLAAIIQSDLEKEVATINSEVFLSVFTKRSTETPAQEHPRKEQEAMEKLSISINGDDTADSDSLEDEPMEAFVFPSHLSEKEKVLFELLTPEKKHFDDLHYALKFTVQELCVSILELQLVGLIERHGGDYYSLKEKPVAIRKNVPAAKDSFPAQVLDFIDFIKVRFHGISRKCLQLYLSLFWSSTNRKRWGVDSMAKACREHPPITGKEVLTYVCPLVVNIASGVSLIS